MRVLSVMVAAVIACAFSAIAWADDAGPGRISTLTAGPGKTTAALYWTAGGGDCASGNASTFEVRQWTSTITDTNWQDASVVASGNSVTNGNQQCASITSLTCNTTYYFVVFTFDASGNRSPLGNVVSTTTLACIPSSYEITCE